MNFQPHIVLKISMISMLVLAGCGQRGPLYHPEMPAALPEPAQSQNTDSQTKQDESTPKQPAQAQ